MKLDVPTALTRIGMRKCVPEMPREIDELDMNPLLVYERGKGALVLDARFLLK